jgi:hypothetical protein
MEFVLQLMTLPLYQNLLHHVLRMLRRVRFVLQPMKLLLCQDHRRQIALKRAQKYVAKNHQKSHHLVQMGMGMGTVMEMKTEVEEKMGQTGMEKMEEILMIIMVTGEPLMVAANSLNDINKEEGHRF